MAFLTINGWTIPILDGSFSVQDVDVGQRGPGYSGASRDARRAIGLQVRATAVVQGHHLAMPLEELLRGKGHHFPFDETLYAESGSGVGVGPEAGYSATLVTAAPAPKYGTRCLKVPSGTTISWIVDEKWYADYGQGEYTIMFWFWNGASWDHYIMTSAPNGTSSYKNGVYATPAPSNYQVTETSPGLLTVELQGQNAAGVNADAYFDDLVILPYSLDVNGDNTAWESITGFYGAGRAFSALPRLDVGGSWYRNGEDFLEMVGTVVNSQYRQAQIASVFSNSARMVEFLLTEAAPKR